MTRCTRLRFTASPSSGWRAGSGNRQRGTGVRVTPVLLLVNDRDIRIINAATGELLRTLTLDPTRDYQPIGTPKTKKPGP